MDGLPFNPEGLEPNDVQSFLANYNALKEKFPAKFDNVFEFDFSHIESLGDYDRADSMFAIDITKNDKPVHVALTQVEYSYIARRGSKHIAIEYQAFAVARLKKNCGHIIVRHKTWLDKVQDIFQEHIEIEFEEDKNFSRHYFVLARDKDLAKKVLTDAARNAICEIERENFFIEILDDSLVMGDKDALNPGATLCFAESAHKIAAIL